MKEKFDISVLIAFYHPIWEKVKLTLQSIITQKNISLQIVITDDGSADNLFSQTKEYFAQNSFEDYTLLPHEQNSGTVLSLYDGLQLCQGKYVKLFSPGDFLSGEYVLREWIAELDRTHSIVSFSKAIYYYKEEGRFCAVSAVASPQCADKWDTKLKKYYLLCDDFGLGAATLMTTAAAKEYFSLIKGKVVYAEDNIYRIMAAKGEKFSFYQAPCIYYEYGDGISTGSSSIWRERLEKDILACNEVIYWELGENTAISKCLKEKEKANSGIKKVLYYFMHPTIFLYKLKRKLFPKRTPTKLNN